MPPAPPDSSDSPAAERVAGMLGADAAADPAATLIAARGAVADDDPALARLLDALLARLGRLRFEQAAQVQRLQFTLGHLQARAAPGPAGRLTGDARAMGLLLARALAQLPETARAGLLDGDHYLRANPDVAAQGQAAAAHYVAGGAAEGRAPMDLRRAFPECYGDRPARLADLGAAAPGFVPEFPEALRAEALALLGRARPAVSVIVPVWNRTHVAGRAVASALLQSYAPAQVIVVDDGSTDGTPDQIRHRFPEALAEGRLVLLEVPHGGVSAARNAGLTRAGGDIIAYLDSDNFWEPDHLLFACAGLGQAGAQAAYTALCRHNLDDGWSDVLFRPFDRAALAAENYIDLNTFVHVRALYDRLGGFDSALTRLVDWDLILRYSAAAAPLALPVITGHYMISRSFLGNITTMVDAAPNIARIRAKQARDAPG